MILCLFGLCLRVLLTRVPTLLVIIFCTVYITPKFIMTLKGFVVKFCEILTFFSHAPMLVCFMIFNGVFHDTVSPYDVDDTISNTDPMLWKMIVFLTSTVKHVPPDKISQHHKLQTAMPILPLRYALCHQ